MQNWKPTDSLTGTLMEIRETDCERGTEKMEKTIEKKRKKEQAVVREMIFLYCRKKHRRSELCPSCRELLGYAQMRSECCPFMETKTFCSNCRVHCYKLQMREKIREVMAFSGPRMMLYHPVMAVWHAACSVREKRKMRND